MYGVWNYTSINGYLYTAVGIVTCFVVGYSVSLFVPLTEKDLTGLTVYTLQPNS
jgi:hypothetical protein